MKVSRQQIDSGEYAVYLGPDKFTKGPIVEADDVEGYIIWEQPPSWWGSSDSSKPKRTYGKVYIVRIK